MFVCDLLLNPDEEKHYKLYPFWSDEIHNFVQTYRMGQTRVDYLAERYGEHVVQDVYAKSYLMTQRPDMQPTDQIFGFQSFIEDLTATKPKALDEDFKNWLRTKFDIARLEKTEEVPKLEEQKAVSDTMDSYDVLPDGFLAMYRDVDITTGNTRLRMVDLRDESSRVTIAEEGKPGIESLHFFQRGVFAMRDGELAFVGLDKARDVLYLQSFERKVEPRSGDEVNVKLRLGERRPIDLKPIDLYEAGDLAFSPDGKRLAFIGLTPDGKADVYVADLAATDISASIRRISNDFYAERTPVWGPNGILLASDRTPKGFFNLFLLDPDTGVWQQLTNEEANDETPSYGADGSILFTSHANGKSNVYRLSAGKLERLTDTHTGLFEPRDVPGGMLVRRFFRGRFRLYKAAASDLKPLETRVPAGPETASLVPEATSAQQTSLAAAGGAASSGLDRVPMGQIKDAFARLPLSVGKSYKSGDLSNWRLDVGGAGLSTDAYGGVYLAFSDRMRDQSVIFDVAINGDFRYTDANVFYINRKDRLGWGFGALHTLNIRRDTTFSDDPLTQQLYLERDFGVYGIAQYPFNRFTHVQLGLGVLGVDRFDYGGSLDLGAEEQQWNQATGGTKPEFDLSLSGGYDTVGYQYATGPVNGISLFGKIDYSFIPGEGSSLFAARTDLQKYHADLEGRESADPSDRGRQLRRPAVSAAVLHLFLRQPARTGIRRPAAAGLPLRDRERRAATAAVLVLREAGHHADLRGCHRFRHRQHLRRPESPGRRLLVAGSGHAERGLRAWHELPARAFRAAAALRQAAGRWRTLLRTVPDHWRLDVSAQ